MPRLSPGNPASRRPGGFTLIEVIVAIGAVALVSVGLAAIFDSVGKTVSGGRRVSLLNTYAGLLERNMRRDFDRMSRDSFIAIRQQYVDVNGDGVFDPAVDRVAVDDQGNNRRPRRIDEIVFIAKGEFTSSRQPLSADSIVKGSTARVYYGHGQRRRPFPEADQANLATYQYFNPRLYDNNVTADPGDAALAPRLASAAQMPNPNQYASDWTLLRSQLLLVKPEVASAASLSGPVFGINPATPAGRIRLSNKVCQIGLQPAVPSIFRAINRRLPDPASRSANDYLRTDIGDPTASTTPNMASGLIDIATTDEDEIRQYITRYPAPPITILPSAPLLPFAIGFQSVDPAAAPPVRNNPTLATVLDSQHSWMEDAFPAQSAPQQLALYTNVATEADSIRMRYEPKAVNILDAMNESSTTWPTPIDRAIARADQLMLTSSTFVPRCTDLVIEWSYALTQNSGELVWHGLDRRTDTNNNGRIDAGDDLTTRPYPFAPDGTTFPVVRNYPRVGTGTPGTHTVTNRLIYGFVPVGNESCLTSHFGYNDPTFAAPLDNDQNGVPDAGQPAIGVLPWAWPRMIRITLTLSDPQDPTIESTFQFIFRTPDEPTN